ncbi:MAG: tRNA(Ile)-lysidine synthetase [Deltaproteobacteria bacterium]|jgi:uncharacterized protein|nr:tRNA(Ile)-lysidine synthetase [Deltaproteobacteria bacterium]
MPDAARALFAHPLWDRLRAVLDAASGRGPLAVAFSGGLDSRFLAHAAQGCGQAPLLVHMTGPHITPAESAWARHWAHSRKLKLLVLEGNPLDLPEVAAGDKDRCYHCKRLVFSAIRQHLAPGAVLCDGTNHSDLETYRPGLRAVRELDIRSPLAEAGLTKALIHELAGLTGLDRPNQRPRPCLLTRFAYGLRPSRDLLRRLAEAEVAVADLLRPETHPASVPATDAAAGFTHEDALPDFRLRLPRPHTLELHCAGLIPPLLHERIRDAVAALGLPRPDIVHLPALSGYFDAHDQAETARGLA